VAEHPLLQLLATPTPDPPNPPSAETLAQVDRIFQAAWGGDHVPMDRQAFEGAILAASACTNRGVAERIHDNAIAAAIDGLDDEATQALARDVIPTLTVSSDGILVDALAYLAATDGLPHEFALRHMEIEHGRIRLDRRQLRALARHHVKRLCPLPATKPPPWVLEAYGPLIARANRAHAEHRRRIQAVRDEGRHPESYPPCIRRFLEKLADGQHVSHHERFNLVAFLHMFGASETELVDLFRTQPGFSEAATQYQIRHITAKPNGDGPKGYAPMGCRQMRDLAICPDATCPGPTPALLYSRTRLRGRP
jgi:hypothetical protein